MASGVAWAAKFSRWVMLAWRSPRERISRSVFMIPPWRFGAVRSAVGLIVVSIAAVG